MWVELVQDLKDKVVGENRISDRQDEINSIVAQYLNNDITAEEQYWQLLAIGEEYADIPRLELPYPGPLYGLLRLGAGWSREKSTDAVIEERSHFDKSRKNGFTPSISIEVEKKRNDKGELEFLYWAFVISHVYSEQASEDKKRANREELREVFIAPTTLSPDDMAKLPSRDILYQENENN